MVGPKGFICVDKEYGRNAGPCVTIQIIRKKVRECVGDVALAHVPERVQRLARLTLN